MAGVDEAAVGELVEDTKSLAVKPKKTKKKNPKSSTATAAASSKMGNRDGMEFTKAASFPEWYNELVVKAGLIEFYDISGCYILRPLAFSVWDTLRLYLDTRFAAMGVSNAYFPLFVSRSRLVKEESHIEGFAAEVAWVTKSGSSDLKDPIAVRPTSETIMYPSFSKWIRSHRDLPLKINQWSNVVRWEFKHPTPFIRSREFLWQEGHTAYAAKEEADFEVRQVLDIYKDVYEGMLAVPVIRGQKSEKEKFAGGLYTTTVEGFIPANGRAIQGATSHGLGQNFAKMFDIVYESAPAGASADKGAVAGQRLHVWQNSWGLTTRTIGVMIMVHGDDTGLVLPPRVAPTQIVIIPITSKGKEEMVGSSARELHEQLASAGLRVELDDRTDKKPGWKFNYWELRGVPLRIELGPRDIDEGHVMAAVRHNKQKDKLSRDAALAETIKARLDQIQADMLVKARVERDSRISWADDWPTFMAGLSSANMVLGAWCNKVECEEAVKKKSGLESETEAEANPAEDDDGKGLSGAAKTLCLPFAEELERLSGMVTGYKEVDSKESCCFVCGDTGSCVAALWGRSY